MSTYLKPTLYSKRGLQNQWVNIIYQSHDLICGCNKPIDHLNDVINQQKCLHLDAIGGPTTTNQNGDADDFPLDEGDLQQLFEKEEEEQKR